MAIVVRRRFANSGFSHPAFASVGLIAALCAPLATTVSARTLTIEDMRRIAVLQQPAISPDGRQIALIAIRDERPELLLVATANGHSRIIATGRGVADPRWSPDGSRLGYLQNADGHLQLFLFGARRGSQQLTHSATGLTDFAWSPSGTSIAFSSPDRPSSAPFFYAGDNDATATSATPPVHLWLIPSAGGPARRLTAGSWTIAPTDSGGIFSPQFVWSRDGSHIVLTRVANTFPGDDEYSTLWNLDVRSGRMNKLTARPSLELSPSFSPDGRSLLYWYARGGNFLAFNTLRLRNARGSERDVTAGFDYNVGGALWMPGSNSLLVCANAHTQTNAWTLSLHGTARPLALGNLSIVCDSYQSSTFDSGIAASISRSGAIAFLASSPHHARELCYVSSPFAKPRVLTHFNDGLASLDLGAMREIAWLGSRNVREYGVVTFPPNMRPGHKYPIVVNVHGGPGDSSIRSFVWEAWPRAQLMASHGYIVFEPNYRGSDDAGNVFALAIAGDSVAGPADDILRGLQVVRRLPQADGTKIGVCGWSYGGLMTSWLITQRHFWRAAISGAAVNDEGNEYATSISNVQDRYYLGTSPYAPHGAAVYAAQSPITYAAAVTTPTLIWGTTFDPVVPIAQAYEFYHALREHHVAVRFAVFPASTHGPADARQTASLSRLWLAWLDRYLK